MSEHSGERVGVEVAVADTPERDFDRLFAYITGRFSERDRQLVARARATSQLMHKSDLVALGFEALDFRRELSGWIALTRRVRDEMYADAIDSSHGERLLQAKDSDLKRADSTLVKTRAAASIAPMSEALERLQEARVEMDRTLSWCQSLQRAIHDDEFGDLFEANDVPDELYSAPFGAALRKLEH